ncbi:VOC family protein [Mycobacterium paraffinicum]|nr:VOC family protein [Mycobacterium paraffinicum]
MPDRITCVEMQHLNIVAPDFEATVSHFRDLFGAQFVLDLPNTNWHAGLLYLGGVLIELFAPNDFFLNSRYGAHYIGVEYEVGELDSVRRNLTERDIGLVRDIGVAIHTDPADTHGVAFEFYAGNFHRDGVVEWLEPLRSAEYWREEHPMGLAGLKRYSVATARHAAAVDFYRDTFDVCAVYDEERPHIGARVTGLQLADTVVELISPLGPGVIEDHLCRHGEGIRSIVLAVADIAKACGHLARRGVVVGPGDHPDSVALAPEHNRGLLMELAS